MAKAGNGSPKKFLHRTSAENENKKQLIHDLDHPINNVLAQN